MNTERSSSRWIPPDVARLLVTASEDDQRKVARTAALLAMQRVGLADPRLAAAQERLARGEYGDTPERHAVQALTEELDEVAWNVQEEVDAGKRSYDDYSKAFAKARAANVAWCALDRDPYNAASEALYEAQHALDDPDELYASIRPTLTGQVANKSTS